MVIGQSVLQNWCFHLMAWMWLLCHISLTLLKHDVKNAFQIFLHKIKLPRKGMLELSFYKLFHGFIGEDSLKPSCNLQWIFINYRRPKSCLSNMNVLNKEIISCYAWKSFPSNVLYKISWFNVNLLHYGKNPNIYFILHSIIVCHTFLTTALMKEILLLSLILSFIKFFLNAHIWALFFFGRHLRVFLQRWLLYSGNFLSFVCHQSQICQFDESIRTGRERSSLLLQQVCRPNSSNLHA